MKKSLLIVLVLISFKAAAQLPGHVPYKSKENLYSLALDSSLYPAVRDTTFTPLRIGALTTRPQDTVMYQAIAITAGVKRWSAMAKRSDIVIIDTAGKWVTMIEKNTSGDSTVFWIGGVRYAIYDRGGGSSAVPIDSLIGQGWALRFDRNKHHQVAAGEMYPQGIPLGNCFYQAWVSPSSGAEYVFAPGHGGAHAGLFGFSGNHLSGNIWNGTSTQSFSSGADVDFGTVHHIAMSYDTISSTIYTYIDGIPCGANGFTGRRYGADISSTHLEIGGTDHSNYNGDMFRVQIFEGCIPIIPGTWFYPPYQFDTQWPCVALSYDFTTPVKGAINDLSPFPYLGVDHDGFRTKAGGYQKFGAGYDLKYPESELPQWVRRDIIRSAYTGSAPSIPSGAVLHDGFSRQNSTPADKIIDPTHPEPSIGSTEGGSAGVQTWSVYNPGGGVAILDGQMAFLGIQGNSIVAASCGQSNQDINITVGTFGHDYVRVYGRYTDGDNYVYAERGGGGVFNLKKKVAGVESVIATYTEGTPQAVTTFRLKINGSTAEVYRNTGLIMSGSVTGVPLGTTVGYSVYTTLTSISAITVY